MYVYPRLFPDWTLCLRVIVCGDEGQETLENPLVPFGLYIPSRMKTGLGLNSGALAVWTHTL